MLFITIRCLQYGIYSVFYGILLWGWICMMTGITDVIVTMASDINHLPLGTLTPLL